MLSVKEMLNMKGLEGLEVVAGFSGLDRQVKTVTVMDAPDIFNWMKGGEFLITSGNPIKEDPTVIKSLLEKLNEHNVSAFGIKTTRFLGTIPQDAIDMANELDFPLIFIPNEFAFTDIINPVLSNIVSMQAERLKFSDEIHKSFTALALTEQPVERILETLSRIIGTETAFFDLQFIKLFVPKSFRSLKERLESYGDEGKRYNSILKDFDTYAIKNDITTYGLIIMGETSKITMESCNIALEHAATILILDTQKRISNSQIAGKYRDELVHDIIYDNINTENELINRARLYGWDFRAGAVAVIVDIDNFKQNYVDNLDTKLNTHLEITMNMLYTSTTRIVKAQFKNVAYSKLNDSIVFIISEKEKVDTNKLKSIFSDVREDIKSKSQFTATVGVGRIKENPMDIHKSYEEAKKCIEISHNLKSCDMTVMYDKLGIYKLVNVVLASSEAEELLKAYILPLKAYDEKSSGSLLSTFITICESDWNLKTASARAFVHYNTVKYRFSKICQILNTDFQSVNEKTQAEIAVKVYEMMGH